MTGELPTPACAALVSRGGVPPTAVCQALPRALIVFVSRICHRRRRQVEPMR